MRVSNVNDIRYQLADINFLIKSNKSEKTT